MWKATLGTRILDTLHKCTVLGLISYCGFQTYQVFTKAYEFNVDSPHMHSTYFEDTEKKVEEESQTAAGADYLDRYRDEKYLKGQVNPKK